MQIILDLQDKSILKIEKGEECLDVLESLAKEKDRSFSFSIIGACSFIGLSYYDLKTKKYFTKEFNADSFEILSLSGNVAWCEGEPVVHAHGVFSGENYECFGGHVSKLVISITGEAVIDWLPQKINKKYDPVTGLKFLCQ